MWGTFYLFLTVSCVWNLFLQYWPQGFSWGHLSLRAPQVLWIGGAGKQSWPTCNYRNCPQGGSTYLCSTEIPHATRALRRDSFLGSELEWAVPEQTPKGLSLTISSPKAPPTPSRLIPAWGMTPCCGAKESALSGRRLLLGVPAPGDLNTWWLHLGPLGLRVRPPSFGCTLDSGHSQGKPGKTGLKDVSWRAFCWPQSSHGTQHHPDSRDRILSQIMEVSGRKLDLAFHSCCFLYSHADVILKYSWFAFCACP